HDALPILESLLMRVRDGQLPLRVEMADPLLRGVDALRSLLRGLPDDTGEPATELLAQLAALLDDRSPAVEAVDPFALDCAAQRRKGHHVVRVALPARKRDRAKLLEKLARYGELVPEPGAKGRSAVVGSALEPDLLAEALGFEASSLEVLPVPGEGAVDEFPLVDPGRPLPLYFGQIAVDLRVINDLTRGDVRRAQRTSLLRRSFSDTAVSLGLLSVDQAEAIAAAQAERLADAELPAHPFEDEEME